MKSARLAHDDGRTIADLELTASALERSKGLLGRPSLPAGAGMWFAPARSIHTWWMRFPIDIVFLDESLRVVKLVRRVRPFRLAWGGWTAHAAVELAAGEADRLGVEEGMQLRLLPVASPPR